MRDTSPQAERRYFELLSAQTPLQRLESALRLSRTVRELAVAGIRAVHPNASPSQMKAHLANRLYGREVAENLYPEVNLDE